MKLAILVKKILFDTKFKINQYKFKLDILFKNVLMLIIKFSKKKICSII